MSLTLTAAQLRWLENSAPNGRCCLVRLTVLGDGGFPAPSEMKAYISTMPYITHASDTPAHQIFEDCIVEAPSFTMRMSEQFKRRSEMSYGDLIVANPTDWPLTTTTNLQTPGAGVRDAWLSMNWDGRRIEAWIGDPSWPFADFIPYIDGVTLDVFEVGQARIGFKISGKEGLLDRQIMLDTIPGSGPDAGSPMPLIYGFVTHFEPKLEDPSTHKYRITKTGGGETLQQGTFGVDYAPSSVYEDGSFLGSALLAVVSVDTGTDLITVTGHGGAANSRFRLLNLGGATAPGNLAFNTDYWMPASGLTADTFKAAATLGGAAIDITTAGSGTIWIQVFSYTVDYDDGSFVLVASPEGRITAAGNGLDVSAATPKTVGDIIEQVLTSTLTNTPLTGADIDATSLSDFKALCDSPVGIYIDERMTFADLLDKLVLSVGGWWAFSRLGKLTLGRLDLPVGSSPAYSFNIDDVGRGSFKRTKRILPKLQVTLRTDINYAPLSTVAGSVEEAQRVEFMRPHLEFVGAASSFPSWASNPTLHLRATTPEAQDTLLVNDQQQAEADRQAELFQYPTAVSAFDTHHGALVLEIGDEIAVDHPRYSGDGIVVGVTFRVKGKSTVEFFHQTPDTYPTEDL